MLILQKNLLIPNIMKVFLIGFMGCGKSTIGRALAERLEFDFVDTDALIEERLGMKIEEVVATKGEMFFRHIETELLREITSQKDDTESIIVACGGGMACCNTNLLMMLYGGTTIYLQSSENVLYDRLKNEKSNRFLIKNKTDDELKTYIAATLSQRHKSYYSQADMIISNNDSVDDCIEKLLNKTLFARLFA